MRLREDVALARRQVRDHVVERHGFEALPGQVSSSFEFETQSSGVGLETGSEVFRDGDVHPRDPAKFLGHRIGIAPVGVWDLDLARAHQNFFSEILVSS